MGRGETWGAAAHFRERFQAPPHLFGSLQVGKGDALQVDLVEVGGQLERGNRRDCRLEAQLASHRGRHLRGPCLQIDFAVLGLDDISPANGLAGNLDQLRRDTQRLPRALDGAGQEQIHVERGTDLSGRCIGIGKGHSGRLGNDAELSAVFAYQAADQLGHEAGGEGAVRFSWREVLERQYGNAWRSIGVAGGGMPQSPADNGRRRDQQETQKPSTKIWSRKT